MVAMERDTAKAIRGSRKERPRKLPVEFYWSVPAPFSLAQHHQWNGRIEPVLEEPLMGGRVIEVQKGLMGLLKLQRRGRQRELIIIQAPLHIEMRFHPIKIAFPFGTLHRPMVNLQA